jgi:hypothetical protein
MESNDLLILNPKTNRYVKKTSQTGSRLLKELSIKTAPQPVPQPQPTPIQNIINSSCADLVVQNPEKFRDLTATEMDQLFKKLLLERLGVKPPKKETKKAPAKKTKKTKFKIVSSESDSDSDSDSD